MIKIDKYISPSMMCADFLNLKNQIKKINKLDVDMLHIDVMDGCFVQNYSLFPGFVKHLRSCTKLPMDYHFMIEDPSYKMKWFDIREGDYVSVHIECNEDSEIAINYIKETGAKAGIAIKPMTSVEILEPLIDKLDFVVIMTVNPGFAGQALIPETLEKISQAKEYFKTKGREDILIEVDGNVSFENAKIMAAKGADIFVAGTSGFFRKDMELNAALDKLKSSINEGLNSIK